MKKNIVATFLIITALFISCSTHKATSSGKGIAVTLYSYESSRGDAVFSRIVPNNNYGSIEDIHLYAWTQSDILNVNRVLLDFNTSEIAQNEIIKRAYLNLYFNPTSKYDQALPGEGTNTTVDFIIEKVISDWNEKTVTWATQPDVSTNHSVLVNRKTDTKANYLKLDVTELVQDMINKPINERFGLMLKLEKEIPYNVYFFASGNHPDVNLRPSLQIEY